MRTPTLCCLIVAVFSFATVGVLADSPQLQTTPDAARRYDLAQREAQYQKLLSIPDAVVEYGRFGRVRQLDGHSGILLPDVSKLKTGDSAAAPLLKLKSILLAGGSESLVIREVVPAPKGAHYLFTNQTIDGIPVIDGRVNFILAPNGEVVMMSSLFVPRGNATLTPKLSLELAKAKLEQALSDTEVADAGTLEIASEGSLVFWGDEGKAEIPHLLWMIEASYAKSGEPQVVRFGVDAASGEIRHSAQALFGLNRSVYTNAYRTSIVTPASSSLLFGEGGFPSPADPYASSVYDRVVGAVHAWAGTPFGYDVLGLVVHHGTTKYSGFIYGTDFKPYLFFGDQRAFDDDAIAHEYGHGLYVNHVPGPSSGFLLWDDYFSGNEFYGDLSAVMTDIWRFNGVRPTETWAITELRDWRDPLSKGSLSYKDWYPDRWFANPAVGIRYANSTIYGHAVYLMINGGQHKRVGATFPQVLVGGPIPAINVSPADPSKIKQVLAYGVWRLALYNHKFTGPNFRDHTVAAAFDLYGPATIVDTVDKAWQAVGIRHACSASPPIPSSYTIEPYFCGGGHRITWPAVPGVKYHGEVVKAGFPWDMAQTAFDMARSDVGTSQCTQNVTTTVRFHMRACNGCGCSDWTPAQSMQFYQDCQ